MGGIFNHLQVISFSNIQDRIHIAGMAVEMNGKNRLDCGLRIAEFSTSSILLGSILRVSGSISTRIGRAPTCPITWTQELNVMGVVMTASPEPIPKAAKAICRAAVPELLQRKVRILAREVDPNNLTRIASGSFLALSEVGLVFSGNLSLVTKKWKPYEKSASREGNFISYCAQPALLLGHGPASQRIRE